MREIDNNENGMIVSFLCVASSVHVIYNVAFFLFYHFFADSSISFGIFMPLMQIFVTIHKFVCIFLGKKTTALKNQQKECKINGLFCNNLFFAWKKMG